MEWIRFPTPPVVLRISPTAKTFKCTNLTVMVAQEDSRWHLSISHPLRYPRWDEIKEARYDLVPNDVTMAMILPPQEQYVNVHPNCFHLHEIDN